MLHFCMQFRNVACYYQQHTSYKTSCVQYEGSFKLSLNQSFGLPSRALLIWTLQNSHNFKKEQIRNMSDAFTMQANKNEMGKQQQAPSSPSCRWKNGAPSDVAPFHVTLALFGRTPTTKNEQDNVDSNQVLVQQALKVSQQEKARLNHHHVVRPRDRWANGGRDRSSAPRGVSRVLSAGRSSAPRGVSRVLSNRVATRAK
jgi:hypothetical protein